MKHTIFSLIILLSLVLSACGSGSSASPATPTPIPTTTTVDPLDNLVNDHITKYNPAALDISTDGEWGVLIDEGGSIQRWNMLEITHFGNANPQEIIDLRVNDEGIVTWIWGNSIFKATSAEDLWVEGFDLTGVLQYLVIENREFIILEDLTAWSRILSDNPSPWIYLSNDVTGLDYSHNLVAIEREDLAVTVMNLAQGESEVIATYTGINPQIWGDQTLFIADEHGVMSIPLGEIGIEGKSPEPLCASAGTPSSYFVFSWHQGDGGTMMIQNGGIWRCGINPHTPLPEERVKQVKLDTITNDEIIGVFADSDNHDILVTMYTKTDYTAYDLETLPKP